MLKAFIQQSNYCVSCMLCIHSCSSVKQSYMSKAPYKPPRRAACHMNVKTLWLRPLAWETVDKLPETASLPMLLHAERIFSFVHRVHQRHAAVIEVEPYSIAPLAQIMWLTLKAACLPSLLTGPGRILTFVLGCPGTALLHSIRCLQLW